MEAKAGRVLYRGTRSGYQGLHGEMGTRHYFKTLQLPLTGVHTKNVLWESKND